MLSDRDHRILAELENGLRHRRWGHRLWRWLRTDRCTISDRSARIAALIAVLVAILLVCLSLPLQALEAGVVLAAPYLWRRWRQHIDQPPRT